MRNEVMEIQLQKHPASDHIRCMVGITKMEVAGIRAPGRLLMIQLLDLDCIIISRPRFDNKVMSCSSGLRSAPGAFTLKV